jgi:hypothetical protein
MTIGDGPIDPKYKESMLALAKGLDQVLNKRKTGDERHTGFVLLVFPFGDESGRCNYISNGASRKDIIRMFKFQLKRMKELLKP